ncbi:MAG: cytochrome ubiquinol oxidase subunit I, partial [Shinella sp.]
PAEIGWDWFNLISTIGSFIFAAGVAIVVIDVLRPKHRQPKGEQNPWNAGTLEWISGPEEKWGVRSIPIITSRYPIWDQPGLIEGIKTGRYYLPDTKDGARETLVTSVLDAEPIQCLRVGGTSVLSIIAAFSLGGVFIALTFHWWIVTIVCAVMTLAAIVAWLWTGTAAIPKEEMRDVGLGRTLPLYTSGPQSVGWWAMFITMAGDSTAYASLMFGYFFYWTIHDDFTAGHAGPGTLWPLAAAGLFTLAWLAMLAARKANEGDRDARTRLWLALSALLTFAAGCAGLAGPYLTAMDPTAHVYPAIVWVVTLWTVVHGGVGVIMQAYCLARSLTGRMSARHDMDLRNVVLYWHFLVITAITTFGVLGLFPGLR